MMNTMRKTCRICLKKEVDIEYSYSEADVPPADDEYYAENVPYLSEKEVDIEYSYSEADVPPVDDEYYAENVPYLSEKETSNDCYIKWSKDYKEAARLVYKKRFERRRYKACSRTV